MSELDPWASMAWRIDYNILRGRQPVKAKRDARKRMLKIRREAALERKLEAAQRTIKAQAEQLEQAQRAQRALNQALNEGNGVYRP